MNDSVLVVINRPCVGRMGQELRPGDRVYLHQSAAEAYVKSGRARYAKVAVFETKSVSPPFPLGPVDPPSPPIPPVPVDDPTDGVSMSPDEQEEESPQPPPAQQFNARSEAYDPRHSYSRPPGAPLPCPHCGRPYKSLEWLNRHIERNHSGG